jgi:hypothetical protein
MKLIVDCDRGFEQMSQRIDDGVETGILENHVRQPIVHRGCPLQGPMLGGDLAMEEA